MRLSRLMAVWLFTVLLMTAAPAAHARPTVDDHYPADGARNVPVNVTIFIEFSEDMDGDSVVEGISLYEAGGAEVPGKVTYDASSRQAAFKPDGALEYDTRYRVRLSGGIENEHGSNLAARSFYFTTARLARVYVDSVEILDEILSVNHSPVDITVDAPGAARVMYQGKRLEGGRGSYVLEDVLLKPGGNNFSFQVVYRYDDEDGKEQEDILTVKKTLQFVNLPGEGATATVDLKESKKVQLFDKQLTIDFPKQYFLGREQYAAPSQLMAFRLEKVYSVDGSPAVSYQFHIAYVERRGDEYRHGSFSDVDPGVQAPPGGMMTLPLDELNESALRTVTVLYDAHDGIPGNWINIGGRTVAGKNTITVPFRGFGRYVAVNRLWHFREQNMMHMPFVEYLWAKGIMYPSPAAPPGSFGLVDNNGREVAVSRGEFAVMLGRALGLGQPDGAGARIFSDIIYDGGYSYGFNQAGVLVPLPRLDAMYIEAAAKNGLINGTRTKDGRFVFGYFEPLTREQAAVSIMSGAGLAVNWSNDRAVRQQLSRLFRDHQQISWAAGPYVLAAVQQGYLQNGEDWTFRPAAPLTRGEAAAMIYKLMASKKLL